MLLTQLPIELLVSLPHYVNNIEDFKNASSTCRVLRDAFSKTSPNCILRLAIASAPVFAQPHPYFLVAATARQVSDWALKSEQNTIRLRQALRGGFDGLLELCKEQTGLSMDDIRRLHFLRFSAINPTSDLIDRAAGPTWASTPDFWYGGVSDANTIDCDPGRATYQIVVYGELFASSMEAVINPSLNLPQHSLEMRLDYLRYCIPDWVVAQGYDGMEPPDRLGAYKMDTIPADQIALNHLLWTNRWTTAWSDVRQQIGPDFEDWKENLWNCAVQQQGLEGLEMLGVGGIDKWRERLVKMRAAIEKLEGEEPKAIKFGNNSTNAYPDMASDVYVLMAGLWPQPHYL